MREREILQGVELLGMSINEVRFFIDFLMWDGVTWSNIHSDHVCLFSSFDLRDKDHVKTAAYCTNIQPLFKKNTVKVKSTQKMLYGNVAKEFRIIIIFKHKWDNGGEKTKKNFFDGLYGKLPKKNHHTIKTVKKSFDDIWPFCLSDLVDHGPENNRGCCFSLDVIDNFSKYRRGTILKS